MLVGEHETPGVRQAHECVFLAFLRHEECAGRLRRLRTPSQIEAGFEPHQHGHRVAIDGIGKRGQQSAARP